MTRTRGSVTSRKGKQGVRYRARIRVGKHDLYGSWRPTKKAAEADLRKMRKADREAAVVTDVVSLERAWREHLLRLEARETRDTTIRGYRWHWGALMKVFEREAPIAAIDPGDVEEYVRIRKGAGVKMRTIHHELSLLRAVLNTALKRGYVTSNAVTRAELPRVEEEAEPDWFTEGQLAATLIAIRVSGADRPVERDADTIEFLALTGLRISEACAVVLDDIDKEKRLLHVRQAKTHKRTARITERLLPVIERLAEGAQERGGKLLDKHEQLNWMFRFWKTRLQEPRLHAHALRHTFASAIARRTGNPYQIMHALGHRNIKMALRYCHLAGVDVEHLEAISYEANDESHPPEGPPSESPT